MAAKASTKTVNIWTARIIPLVLMGVVGYATYVHVVRLCVDYLLNSTNQRAGAATALLVVYFVLMFPMSTAYFRLLYIVTFEPGYLPLGRSPPVSRNGKPSEKRQRRARGGNRDNDDDDSGGGGDEFVGGREYEAPSKRVDNWHSDADAAGLEEFYSRDVFVCEMDGKPKWCAECGCWKPDRAHHCSDVGRCVRKMDHFCPWVGGVVGENSFKFFIQFVFYTAIYCFFLLAVMACYLHEQLNTPDFTFDPHFAAIIGLTTFFGLFTAGMTMSSGQFALANLTTIENLNKKTKAWQLAVYIPDRQKPPTMGMLGEPFPTVTYPLPIVSEKPSSSTASSDISNGEAVKIENDNSDLAHHSERDAKAKRTFAILRMAPGNSPWDLGVFDNWKSVMGTNVIDWLLPIRRSPLCNHESATSQFKMGKHFDTLLAETGLVSGNKIHRTRSSSGRKKSRRHSRRGSASKKEIEMQKYNQQPP